MKPNTIVKTWELKTGQQVVVRSIDASDLPVLYQYILDLMAEDTFILRGPMDSMTMEDEKKYVDGCIAQIEKEDKIHLLAFVDGVFAGSFEVRRGESRKRHTGCIGISMVKAYRNIGLGKVCMQILIDESKKLGLRLLYLHCFANNPRAIHVYEQLGFVKCGELPGAYAYQGGYENEVMMYLSLI